MLLSESLVAPGRTTRLSLLCFVLPNCSLSNGTFTSLLPIPRKPPTERTACRVLSLSTTMSSTLPIFSSRSLYTAEPTILLVRRLPWSVRTGLRAEGVLYPPAVGVLPASCVAGAVAAADDWLCGAARGRLSQRRHGKS